MNNPNNKNKKKRLIIIGASGHGKVIADIALLNGYEDIVFLDDDESIKKCAGFPVIGKTSEAKTLDGDKVVAIGNAKIRQRIMSDIQTVTLVHSKAVIGRNVEIGEGTVVMAGAVINPESKIGKGCIINTDSSVDHDCIIGDFVHVAVGAHICGTVKVGHGTWIGAGATVSNNISICANVTLGAGTVVVKDIAEDGTYIGVPARKMDKNRASLKGKTSEHIRGGYYVSKIQAFRTQIDWRAA